MSVWDLFLGRSEGPSGGEHEANEATARHAKSTSCKNGDDGGSINSRTNKATVKAVKDEHGIRVRRNAKCKVPSGSRRVKVYVNAKTTSHQGVWKSDNVSAKATDSGSTTTSSSRVVRDRIYDVDGDDCDSSDDSSGSTPRHSSNVVSPNNNRDSINNNIITRDANNNNIDRSLGQKSQNVASCINRECTVGLRLALPSEGEGERAFACKQKCLKTAVGLEANVASPLMSGGLRSTRRNGTWAPSGGLYSGSTTDSISSGDKSKEFRKIVDSQRLPSFSSSSSFAGQKTLSPENHRLLSRDIETELLQELGPPPLELTAQAAWEARRRTLRLVKEKADRRHSHSAAPVEKVEVSPLRRAGRAKTQCWLTEYRNEQLPGQRVEPSTLGE